MALISPKGYAVVEDVNPAQIVVRWHRDAEHRARYKAGKSDAYENTNTEVIALEPGQVFGESTEGTALTVRNLIVSYAYEFLKSSGAIADAEDA